MRDHLARLAGLLLALVLLVPAAPADAVLPPIGEGGLAVAMEAMDRVATDGRRPARQARDPGQPISYGRDGRFTILLLGSDWRRRAGGERLDVVTVMSIDPLTKQAAAVGIPRDMVHIPRARRNGGGNSGGVRVNAIYYISYRDPDVPHEGLDRRALARFSLDIGALLGSEIDAWALVRFRWFARALDAIGGIRMNIGRPVRDPYYHMGRTRGVYFPAARDYRLEGNARCRPYPAKCRSALAYARSRKGTVGPRFNSDYARSGRHPRIVLAAVRRIVEDHGAGLVLLGLLAGVRRYVATSLPTTPAAVAQLYWLLDGATLPASSIEVLGPRTFAYSDSTTAKYTYRPRLSTIRRWVDRHFYPVRPEDGGAGGSGGSG